MYSSFFLTDCVFLLLVDEREDVQKKTFTKWVNSQLAKVRQLPACFPLSTLFTAVYPLFHVYKARFSNWSLDSLALTTDYTLYSICTVENKERNRNTYHF